LGENPVQPGGNIIASNVVVSYLKVGDNFPVVTFPPVGMSSLDELKKVIAEHSESYDVIKIPDFILPGNAEESKEYIKKRMEQFNNLVMKYVEFCRKGQGKYFIEEGKESDELSELAKLSFEFRSSTGLAKDATRFKVNQVLDAFSVNHPQYDLENFRRALDFPGKEGEELLGLYLKKYEAISLEAYEEASNLKKKIQSIEASSEV